MNAQQIVNVMIDTEATGKLEPLELRVIRDARMRLQGAIQTGEGSRIGAAMENGREAMEAWEHKLPVRA